MSSNWTKNGDWVQRWNAGPSYRHSSGRVVVSGGYGTTGDNLRGWRKGRFYRILATGADGVKEIGYASSLATAKAIAEKFLSTSP